MPLRPHRFIAPSFGLGGLTILVSLFSASIHAYAESIAAEPMVPIVGDHPTGFDIKQTRPAPSDMVIRFAVLFADRDPEGFRRFGEAQQNPRSPLYHYTPKPGELHRRFGPKRVDFDAVARWLKSEGFDITYKGYGMAIDLMGAVGSVEQVERTFGVSIVLVGSAGAYANIGDPLIPSRFAGIVSDIYGLNNMVAEMPAAGATLETHRRVAQ